MTAGSLLIEIVAYAPTAFFHCTHCEVAWQATGFGAGLRREQAATALPADLLADYQRVSDWVHHLSATYGPRVTVKVIDAASVEGLWHSLRHGLRRYPAVRAAGGGWQTELDAAESAVAAALAALERGKEVPANST